MILKVNPTRVNLLALKKDLKIAKKGHKLLKDKRDGLMQRFMQIIHETYNLRGEIDSELRQAFTYYTRGASFLTPKLLTSTFSMSNAKAHLEVSKKSIMSVPIPQFKMTQSGSIFSFGVLGTNGDIDRSVAEFQKIFPKLIKLAELEKTVENLADEIERTRRRTSALENMRIPNLQDTIRFINLRIEEQSRDAVVSAMRIKDMITAE